jgi:hypothetical protein
LRPGEADMASRLTSPFVVESFLTWPWRLTALTALTSTPWDSCRDMGEAAILLEKSTDDVRRTRIALHDVIGQEPRARHAARA